MDTKPIEQAEANRHIIKDPQSLVDLFCMEKKREDETSSKVLARVEECTESVKQKGGLRLS